MKINEKNLNAYSVSGTHVDKEGYLMKKGEVNKSFQRRWFVLKGNLLFYFEKRGDKEPIGVIILEGCTIELAQCEDQFSFKIVFNGGSGRTYCLATDTQEGLETWMKALARASYDYLKLMVAELQKQLDELNETDCRQNYVPGAGGGDGHRPPPRRHNPFNKSENIDSTRHRANTVSHQDCTSTQAYQNSSMNQSSRSCITSKRRTFAALHYEYGVPILKDKQMYLSQKISTKLRSTVESTVLVDFEREQLSVEITEKTPSCHDEQLVHISSEFQSDNIDVISSNVKVNSLIDL